MCILLSSKVDFIRGANTRSRGFPLESSVLIAFLSSSIDELSCDVEIAEGTFIGYLPTSELDFFERFVLGVSGSSICCVALFLSLLITFRIRSTILSDHDCYECNIHDAVYTCT